MRAPSIIRYGSARYRTTAYCHRCRRRLSYVRRTRSRNTSRTKATRRCRHCSIRLLQNCLNVGLYRAFLRRSTNAVLSSRNPTRGLYTRVRRLNRCTFAVIERTRSTTGNERRISLIIFLTILQRLNGRSSRRSNRSSRASGRM